MNERLYRSSTDRVFTGLCGGIADYFDIDASLLRILTVVLDIFTGIFPLLVVYVIAAMIVPEEPPVGAPGAWAAWGPGGTAGQPGMGGQPGVAGQPGPGTAPEGGAAPGWTAPPAGADWQTQRSWARQQRRAQRQYWRAQRWGGEPTNVGLVFGVILVVVGGAFLVRTAIPSIDTDLIWPVVLIVLGAVLLAGAVTRR